MLIKEVFDAAEGGTLTYDQFMVIAKDAKFADINEGKYCSKNKYDTDLAAKDKEIETLRSTISTRDTDLENLQKQLEEAGTDATKLGELSNNFSALQTQYETDVKNYKAQLKKQAYEFAVKEFANGKKFTSNAAKRDFIQSMIAKDLKMEKDSILGADDFVTAYSADNADAFVVETPPEPEVKPEPKPTFVNSTPGGDPKPTESNAFVSAFNFTGVRPHD